MQRALERVVLGIRHIGGRIARAGGVCRPAIVAEPGLVVVANAGRKDQEVVVDRASAGAHSPSSPIDLEHLGLQEAIAVLFRHSQVVVRDEAVVDHVDQPLVAHRAREEDRVLLDQHHFGIGHELAQVLGDGEAAPPSAAHDHSRRLAARHQGLVGATDHERQHRAALRRGAGGKRRGGDRCAGSEESASVESHCAPFGEVMPAF
jgi:hypothetical protein